MSESKEINLGDKVRDPISGIEGIAIGKTEWLYQCRSIAVKPMGQKDGSTIKTEFFDEAALELVKRAVITPPVIKVTPAGTRAYTGGPERDEPPARQR